MKTFNKFNPKLNESKEELIKDLLILKENLQESIYKLESTIGNMALIIETTKLYTGTLSIEGYSSLRIVINSETLRIPYEIKGNKVKVYGKITGCFENSFGSFTPISNIPVIESEFLLTPASLGLDSLYISKDSWYKLREYGILPEKFYLTIYITDIEIDGNKVKVYSQRNVKV